MAGGWLYNLLICLMPAALTLTEQQHDAETLLWCAVWGGWGALRSGLWGLVG